MATDTKTKHNYKLEGKGDSPQEADTRLEAGQSDLTAKFKDAGVSEGVTITGERFEGTFTLKPGIDPSEVDATRFHVESTKSWQNIEEKRQRLADGGQYDGQFYVARLLDLTDEQLAATRGTKQTSAGYEAPSADYSRKLPSLRT